MEKIFFSSFPVFFQIYFLIQLNERKSLMLEYRTTRNRFEKMSHQKSDLLHCQISLQISD